jgi:hypothetical protein
MATGATGAAADRTDGVAATEGEGILPRFAAEDSEVASRRALPNIALASATYKAESDVPRFEVS